MTVPIVSIFTSVRNATRWLPSYLECMQGQTYGDLEIVVCDNGSTDGTADVLEDAARTDTRLQIHRNGRDLGMDESFRKAYSLARGRFAKLASVDDRIPPHAIARLVEPLLEHPELVLATSSRDLIDEHGAIQPRWSCFQPILDADGAVGGRTYGDLVLRTCMNWVGESLFVKDLIAPEQIFTFAGRRYASAGDVALSLELLTRGPAWFVVEPLSQFRVHPGQDAMSWRRPVVDTTTWLHLVESGRRVGFLSDPSEHRVALLTFLLRATDVYVRSRDAVDAEHPGAPSPELQALTEAIALAAGDLAAWEALVPEPDLVGAVR